MKTYVEARDLMTVAEVAEELRVDRMTVYRYIRTGRLPAVRVGERSIRVSRAAVSASLPPVEPTR